MISWNIDSQGKRTLIQRQNEQYKVIGGKFVLLDIPDFHHKANILSMVEINFSLPITSSNQFKVNYDTGEVYFDSSKENSTITVASYYSVGKSNLYAKNVPLINSSNLYASTTVEDFATETSIRIKDISANVKIYGAKGDGITDDITPIQAAIDSVYSSGGGTVIIPSGTYKTTSTIVVKTNVHLLCSKGSRIKPLGNHNVIQLKSESKLTGAVVDCTGTPYYSGSAIFLDGRDKFGACLTPTFIENVNWSSCIGEDITVVNNSYTGSGIKLYCSNGNQFIQFTSFSNLQVIGFDKGIWLQCDAHDGSLGSSFVNANNFINAYVSGCQYGYYLSGTQIPYEVSGNIFKNIQYQTFYWFTIRAIYINARYTRIDGIIWDANVALKPVIMIEIETTAINTIIETNIGTLNYDTILDKGYNTKIVGDTDNFYNVSNPSILNGRIMNGDQDDYLAYAWKRYTIASSVAPTSGSLTNMFDPAGGSIAQWTSPVTPVVIDIDLTSESITSLQFIGIAFLNGEIAKYVKFEYQIGAAAYVTIFERTQNRQVYVTSGMEARPSNVTKLRVTIDQPVGTSISVGRIFAQDSSQTGRVWLSKLGGKAYGDIEFYQTGYGTVIRSPNGTKYRIGINDSGVLTTTLVP